MAPRVIARLLVVACAVVLVPAARAVDEESASAVYGRGIHAYNSGSYESAHALFSKAIELSDRNPRYHLFRGLAAYQLGRADEAAGDFKSGATLEASQPDQPYAVSDALERIQGQMRVEIERARVAARLAEKNRRRQLELARYEALRRREDIVLVDPNRAIPQITIELPESVKQDPADPFRTGMAFTGGQAARPVEKKTTPVDLDPFGDAGDAAGAGGQADPFGGAPANPPAENLNPFGDTPMNPGEVPGGIPAAGAAGDAAATSGIGQLFKILGQAAREQGSRDPFGDEAPAQPPGNDPFGAGKAGDEQNNDPFGAGKAGDDKNDDPFGAGKAGDDNSGKAPGSDPFDR